MEIYIPGQKIPEGKTVKKLRLKDAIEISKTIPKNTELPIDLLLVSRYDRKSRSIQRICRRCKKSFTVYRGYGREFKQLCQLCTDLRNQNER